MSGRTGTRLGDFFSYLFMLAMFVFFAGPLTYLLSMAMRDKREIYRGVARYIPNNPTIDNFITVLNNSYFPLYLWNGLKLAALSGFGVLIVALPAAYAFSRFQFRGKGLSMMALLLFQMISPLVIMVPLYRYMNRLGLLDTHFAVVMVYIALGVPLATWLLKSTVDGIPRSLDEAAMIDGCNRFSVFWRIILPLSAPGIASVFIITVIAGWSQFLVPFLLLTKNDLMPIGVGIFNFRGMQTDSSIQLLAAACLISVVPAIVAFLSLQRLILGAMTSGAVKG
ncbi:carbohydrate ABC transporter permease [Rhizobium anhuiense]|jgi:multiple sugar transport system permease protein|uniref:Maltose/maltodextrin transport system permease protein MalG n=1 Tax=Rhizobium anhuiense TaxID=1184720 RepID=A0ABX4J7P3_9HYPH|nr:MULTISPECIES: carbohydrate ABC transporter permease [Rhizobium]KZS54938.1 ABC transporter permease [Rhizobium anhuiense bv. trifolii]MBB3301770.1 multiple sugar transport system permease protein [Rhizobium sp. BK112]MBB3370760.1 multiple sugar transport system permease protein [Rhizobium sp. BK077]MBB3746721.1 multiple sugar transport system permease protein [Rhizobium sp. BK591]MBB4115552.1 multiple sugar transport system permease protein [Rhizobium sp. BK226]